MIELSKPAHRNSPMMLYKKRGEAGGNFNIITQMFGENLAPFYAQLGLKGHNGIDLIIQDGEPVNAAHNGKVSKIYDKQNSSKTKGYGVYLTHKEGWTTVYWHLTEDLMVKLDDEVKEGQTIGFADNSGEYTMGTHLHFGLYPKDRDLKNGYGGAIDPMPYFLFLKPKSMLKTYQPKGDNRVYAEIDGNYYWITSDRMYKAGLGKIFEPFIAVEKIEPTKIIGTFNKEY